MEKTQNTYAKYCPNVWVAKCEQPHEKGAIIAVTNRHGSEREHVVHNLVLKTDTHYYYSITREDGMNSQALAEKKAYRLRDWADSAEEKSMEYWRKSRKDADFLVLAEPIKIGHHSEKRHRRMLEDAQNNMQKSVEAQRKAEAHVDKANMYERKAKKVDMSMPESLEYFQEEYDNAVALHAGLKDGTIKADHSYSLTYAKKRVNTAKKNLDFAVKLWK